MAPAHVEATDARGAVRVRLGHDGLPESIEVDQDWEHRLRNGSLAQAVVEACRTAENHAASAWTQRWADPHWRERMERAMEADPATARPSRGAPDPIDGPQRPISEVVAEIWEAVDEGLDSLGGSDPFAASAAEPVRGEGSIARGRLVLTLSPGAVVSCNSDPTWLSQRSPDELTEALGAALAAARADLASAVAASPAGRLARLMQELGRNR